jgi:threonine/homoserine/homoserine lactone efflux protein
VGQAIGDLLPFAIGVALSPIPIIAVILMLLSTRAGANGASFLVGWVVGVTGASIVLIAVSASLGSGSSGAPSTSSSVFKLVAGVGLLLLARRNVRKRPKPGETAELPKWLSAIDTLTPVKAAALGVLLSALNPKNLLMIAGAMVTLSQYHLAVGDIVIVIAVFVLVAVSTVAAPVVIFAIGGSSAQHRLDAAKIWLSQNNATVMAVLLLVIGVVLIGKGISGLSS